ncbi:GNAT family N-acetyltransferase [Flavitalea flava]
MIDENIYLRRGNVEDKAILARVAAITFEEAFSSKMLLEDLENYVAEAFSIQKLGDELQDTNSQFILAFAGQELIGYAKLRWGRTHALLESKNSIEIERLYIFAAWHQRKIGSLFMQNCIGIGREKGNEIIWLNVWEKNDQAIRFYERWGFELFDAQLFMRGNDAQTGLLMKKKL